MLKYTVLEHSFECLQISIKQMLFMILVHVIKKHFYLSVGGNHFDFEGQIKVIFIEKHET